MSSSLVEPTSAGTACDGLDKIFVFALPLEAGLLRELVRIFFRALGRLTTLELFGRAGAAVTDNLSVADVGVEAFTGGRKELTDGRRLPVERLGLDEDFLDSANRLGLVPSLVGLTVGRRPGRFGRMVLGLLGEVGRKIDLDVDFSTTAKGPNSSLVNSPSPS